VLEALGRTDEAVRYYTAARSIRPETAHELAHALEHRGESDEAIEVFRQLCQIRARDGRHLSCFGKALQARGRSEESGKILDSAIAALREEIQLHPDRSNAHINFGNALQGQGKHDEAIALYRTAIKLKPDDARAHSNLGTALNAQGKHDEAIAECRTAIKLNPDGAGAHDTLGNALLDQGKLDQAIAEFRTAIKLKPDDAGVHTNLGNALQAQGKLDQAIDLYRTAIKLKPNLAEAHANLGKALGDQGKRDEAVAECRIATTLKPDFAAAHDALGNALLRQGKHDEAIAEFRTAIKLKPDLADAHVGLGAAFYQQGKHDEAIAEWRTAIKLNPDNADAHNNLGAILCDQVHDYPAAEAAFRQSIRLKPDDASTHINLGNALQAQGKHDEAIAEWRTALRLNPDIGGPSWRARVEALAAVANRLPAIVRGDDKPRDAAQGFAAGELCYQKGLHAAAARLYRDALSLDPKRAGDRQSPPRYNAACSAALAGCGQSKDVPPPDEAGRRQLRDQARGWLTAEVAEWANILQSQGPRARPFVARMLQQWRQDSDLAGIRDRDAIKKLPADEQKAWAALWKDVDALLKGGAISQPIRPEVKAPSAGP
jgi:tetratricopeptide (TPR) repeat protein